MRQFLLIYVSHFSLKLYAMQGKRNAGSNKAKY